MSMIEDTHKLLQDVVTPDFKALNVRVDSLTQRVDALEKTMKDGLGKSEASLKEGFAKSDANLKAALTSIDQNIDERFLHMQTIAALNERLAAARHDALSSRVEQSFVAIKESQEALVTYLNLERRIKRIERNNSARTTSSTASEIEVALPKSA